MNKLLLVATALFLVTVMAPAVVSANTQECVTQYGGAVVCGAATPAFHAPVKTGIADINFTFIGSLLIGTSAVLFIKSKRSVAR